MLDAVTRAIEADRTRRSSQQATSGVRDSFARLSPREREVMTLVTRGLMNKQVAHELGLSEITVKLYRGQAMRKMGARLAGRPGAHGRAPGAAQIAVKRQTFV